MYYIYELQSEPTDVYYDCVAQLPDDTDMRVVAKEVKRFALEAVSSFEPCLVEFGEDTDGFPVADIFDANNRVVAKFYAERFA
jgi:hypothetical protein